MAQTPAFPVLVATDGSAHGRIAVAAAVRFPWPARSQVRGVLARGTPVAARLAPEAWAELESVFRRAAAGARRALRVRWPDAEVDVVGRQPVDAILRHARSVGARTIVVGSHGYGRLSRLVLGSVSRAVVRRAACPVLVVGRPLREVRRILVGVDGSEPARRAVELVAALAVPPGGRVALVSVVEPVRLPSTGLLPERVRGPLLAERAALERERTAAARREAEAGARALRRAGWAVDVDVRQGVPLAELLAARAAGQAHVLVLGARGVGGVERLLLGSVADGALTRSPVPVLIVR